VTGGRGAGLETRELDERTILLLASGDADAIDGNELVARVTDSNAERVVLDVTGARDVEAGLAEALARCTDTLAESHRRLVVVSADPDLRQGLSLAAGETVILTASRDEALELLASH
jgi:hypothetical protein